jgi:hypothetical protein
MGLTVAPAVSVKEWMRTLNIRETKNYCKMGFECRIKVGI